MKKNSVFSCIFARVRTKKQTFFMRDNPLVIMWVITWLSYGYPVGYRVGYHALQ